MVAPNSKRLDSSTGLSPPKWIFLFALVGRLTVDAADIFMGEALNAEADATHTAAIIA